MLISRVIQWISLILVVLGLFGLFTCFLIFERSERYYSGAVVPGIASTFAGLISISLSRDTANFDAIFIAGTANLFFSIVALVYQWKSFYFLLTVFACATYKEGAYDNSIVDGRSAISSLYHLSVNARACMAQGGSKVTGDCACVSHSSTECTFMNGVSNTDCGLFFYANGYGRLTPTYATNYITVIVIALLSLGLCVASSRKPTYKKIDPREVGLDEVVSMSKSDESNRDFLLLVVQLLGLIVLVTGLLISIPTESYYMGAFVSGSLALAVGAMCYYGSMTLQYQLRLICFSTVVCFVQLLQCFTSVVFLLSVDACGSYDTENPMFEDVHINSRGNGHNGRAGKCMHDANYVKPGQCSCAIGINKGCYYFDNVPGDHCELFFGPASKRYMYLANYISLFLLAVVSVSLAYRLSAELKQVQNRNVHLEDEIEMLIPNKVVETEKPFAYL